MFSVRAEELKNDVAVAEAVLLTSPDNVEKSQCLYLNFVQPLSQALIVCLNYPQEQHPSSIARIFLF